MTPVEWDWQYGIPPAVRRQLRETIIYGVAFGIGLAWAAVVVISVFIILVVLALRPQG